jgi:hypothetical protein
MIITGELFELEAVPGKGGKTVLARFRAKVEGVIMKTGKYAFQKMHSDEMAYVLKKGETVGVASRRAYMKLFEKLAAKIAVMLAGSSKMEKALLLEAGPLTAEAIALAAKGDMKKAEALFKKASESETERNSGFFGLYVLASFAGKHEEAKAFLKKAGE